jgi:Sulfatase
LAALNFFMKKILLAALLLICTGAFAQKHKTENVILVTFDGYRWQDLFTGADKTLINDTQQDKDTTKTKSNYWAPTPQERRTKLMPFFWGTISRQGMLIGNRTLGSRMNLTNLYKFSFPGYNEIFTGHKDIRINSNEYGDDPNKNIFDFLAARSEFQNKVAAIANWDAFPKIINAHRNGVPVYVNFKCAKNGASCNGVTYDIWQTTCPANAPCAMVDTITYHFAKEYLYRNHPKFAFIGFDETDHYAHEGQYDSYLATAHMLDSYMQDLWNMIQNDPQYKDKTTLIITCDHGRGHAGKNYWHHHGPLVRDAHQVWMAIIGPDTPAKGELVKAKTYHTNQIAATVAQFFGLDYRTDHSVGKPIQIAIQ